MLHRLLRRWNVLLAAGLIFSAAAKAEQLATEPTLETSLLTTRSFMIGWTQFELLFAFWLFLGFTPRLNRILAMALFSLFAGVNLSQATAHEACACMGRYSPDARWMLALSGALVAAFYLCTPHPLPRSRWRFLLPPVAVVWGSVATFFAMAMGTYQPAVLTGDGIILGRGNTVLLEPESWDGRRFPLIDYLDIGSSFAEGNWRIVFFRRDCPLCRTAIAREALAAERDHNSLALIDIASHGSTSAHQNREWEPPHVILGMLSSKYHWQLPVPTVVELREGRVVRTAHGS